MSRCAVVILNWNTREYLERFIPAVLDSLEGQQADLIVADSGSTDSSLEFLSDNYPQVRQIPLGQNYGFTGGYNRALSLLEDSGYDYYVLLNSDIEVTKNWLGPLIEHMDSNPGCGACAPKLHSLLDRDSFEYAGAAGGLLDALGFPYCRGRILSHLEKDHGQYDSSAPVQVLWATGAALMVRSGLWKALGGLDDRFFAHMEEIDLCWRLQLMGYRVEIISDSLIYHLGGGTLPKESPMKLMLNYRNNLMMLQNNLGKTFALEKFKKGLTPKKAATKGLCKANLRIFLRKVLDGGSALVYLCLGRVSSFKAVLDAHRQASELARVPDAEAITQWLDRYGKDAEVKGIGGNVFIEFFKKKI